MFTEIDSTDIIAYLLKDYVSVEDYSIPLSRIRQLADAIETEHKDILVTCDMMSIDAFRCAFSSNVKVENACIVISDVSSIQTRVKRLLPPREVVDIFDEIRVNVK